ncbi:hypothetical protein D3C75_937210 [compost metagenome]
MQQILHKGFAAFNFRCILPGAEYGNMMRFECIDNASRQRIIRPDDDIVNALLLGKSGQLIELEHADRHTFGQLRNPGVAGCAVDFTRFGTAGQAPDDGMLAAAAAHY